MYCWLYIECYYVDAACLPTKPNEGKKKKKWEEKNVCGYVSKVYILVVTRRVSVFIFFFDSGSGFSYFILSVWITPPIYIELCSMLIEFDVWQFSVCDYVSVSYVTRHSIVGTRRPK